MIHLSQTFFQATNVQLSFLSSIQDTPQSFDARILFRL